MVSGGEDLSSEVVAPSLPMSFVWIHNARRGAMSRGMVLVDTVREHCARLAVGTRRMLVCPSGPGLSDCLAPLETWARPVQDYLTLKRVGMAFGVFYAMFVLLALRVLQREHLQTTVPGTYIRNTYSFTPKRPNVSIATTTECHSREAEVVKPYFYRLDDHTYFTNAYFDKRHGGPYIRILSLRRSAAAELHSRALYCLINSATNHSLMAVPAETHPLHDNMDSDYGGYILTCNAHGILYDNPCKVRLSYQQGISDQMVTVPLVSLREKYFYDSSFALCAPPIHDVITQNQLVEFVELNRLLGAEHIFFYLYTGNPHESYMNPNVEQVLRHYVSQGLVTVYPWQLPVDPSKHTWAHAKALSLQHCLYTNMWKYKYLVFSDIDEFLVPHSTNSWGEMMRSIDRESASGYCAQSAYFPPEVTQSLRTLHSYKRTETINTKHMKCIVRPERVFEMGVEGINKAYDESWPMTVVDPDVALVHHYKWCTTDWDFHNCFDFVTDECVGRFEDQLTESYRNVMLLLSGKSIDPGHVVTTYTIL